jgi:hypothetical protein
MDDLKAMPGCVQVGYYRSSLPMYAIQFANTGAEEQHKVALSRMYPDAIFYDFWAKRFESFDGGDKSAEVISLLKKGKCVVTEGTALSTSDMALPGVLSWDEVDVQGMEAVYSLSLETMPERAVAASAEFVKVDTTTQGAWEGVYGSQGFAIANGPKKWPVNARVRWSARDSWLWAASTTSVRALEVPGTSARMASTWYSFDSFSVEVDARDDNTHRVALYFVDWDSNTRAQDIRVSDARTKKVLDARRIAKFHEGQYMAWNVAGDVVITITRVAGGNAVMSGFFLD